METGAPDASHNSVNNRADQRRGWAVRAWTYSWPDGLPSLETPSVGSLMAFTPCKASEGETEDCCSQVRDSSLSPEAQFFLLKKCHRHTACGPEGFGEVLSRKGFCPRASWDMLASMLCVPGYIIYPL